MYSPEIQPRCALGLFKALPSDSPVLYVSPLILGLRVSQLLTLDSCLIVLRMFCRTTSGP